MAGIKLSLKQEFTGVVWTMITHPTEPVIFIEIRDERTKNVSFAAIDLHKDHFIWKDVVFEEPWWISLAETSADFLLFKVYTDTANPEKKSVLAFNFRTRTLAWYRNNFSLTALSDTGVEGKDGAYGTNLVILDLATGQPAREQTLFQQARNFLVLKPLQYYEETAHFSTLKTFVELKCRLLPVSLIEYLEVNSLICISCYVRNEGLANFLFVFRRDGQLLLQEKIGDRLKGIGLDTFFVYAGNLLFVKDKSVLVSYKLYD